MPHPSRARAPPLPHRAALRYIGKQRRLVDEDGRSDVPALDETVNILYTLTSFECFDTLAGLTRSLDAVAPLVSQVARAALSLVARS
jgi:hypothetical protein